jgi:hypothetical protein
MVDCQPEFWEAINATRYLVDYFLLQIGQLRISLRERGNHPVLNQVLEGSRDFSRYYSCNVRFVLLEETEDRDQVVVNEETKVMQQISQGF